MIKTWMNTKSEMEISMSIAKRAVKMAKQLGIDYDVMTADMDISATHVNGCPLKLAELRDADDFNFSHDVFGIRRHLNRETGQLEDCFLPRFSA